MTWYVTRDIHVAMFNSYIGEVHVSPKYLSVVIHYLCTGRVLPPLHLFYYGEPDERLKRMFGYE